MTSREIWFSIAVAGFLVFTEGFITFVARKLLESVSEDVLKMIAGFVIFLVFWFILRNRSHART